MSYLEIAKQALHNARARQEIDRFFVGEILPRLSRLYTAGRLPDLTQDALWTAMESEWMKAAADSPVPCDVEAVKRDMTKAVEAYERGQRQADLF